MKRKAQVITFSNNKGGTGKTTSVANTGAALARRGYKTLLIDLDSQRNLTIFFGVETPDIISEALLGYCGIEELPLFLWDNLDIIAGTTDTTLEQQLADKPNPEATLKEVLKPLLYEYDFILLDTPPAIGFINLNALAASDGVIIPMTPSYLAFRGMAALTEVMDNARLSINKALKVYSVIFTQFNERIIIHEQLKEAIESYYKAGQEDTFTAKVRTNISLVESPAERKDIFRYKIDSNGAKDYDAFALRLLKYLGLPETTADKWKNYADIQPA